jgi:hypothetical protein
MIALKAAFGASLNAKDRRLAAQVASAQQRFCGQDGH